MTHWLYCAENTVEDRIVDFGASFHAIYSKEELERFKQHSGKTLKDVRYISGPKRRLISVGQLDEEGYHVGFRDQIGMSMLSSKDNVLDVRKVDIYFYKPGGLKKQKNLSFIMSVKTRKLQRSCGRYNANLQVKCLKFDNDSTRLRVEALKMLCEDSVSTTCLIYRIPYVLIGLHIPEEEWKRKDTSLVHLKVFGCDSFVRVKDVCGKAMKCTFIGSDSDEMRYRFWDTKSHQSLGGSSNMSEGSKNSESFEDSGRSNEEYSKDGASSKEGGFETPQSYLEALSSKEFVQWKKAINEEIVSLEKNQTCSLVRLPAGKKEPSYVGSLNDTSIQHKSEGFQLAGQKENLECRLNEIMYGPIQASRLCFKMAEFNKPKWVLIFVEESWNEEPCRDVYQVGDEREVEVLCNLNWPLSELITEASVLPERGYSQFNDVCSRYLVSKVS
uniref:Retrovirus-related Pol polyprotein from transposon TNT 1-94 n=1 Tax=Tanacetum cinerariifolium TaxID=118510 RepID=A0A6L2JN57_TANCI|nr:hypothetical protein [Tanacetum cinerariifolium]